MKQFLRLYSLSKYTLVSYLEELLAQFRNYHVCSQLVMMNNMLL